MKKILIIVATIILVLILGIGGKIYMDKQVEKEEILKAIEKDKEQIEEIVRWNFKDVKSVTFEWVKTEKDGSVPVSLDKSLTTTPVGGVLHMNFYLNDDKSRLYGIGINMKEMDELHEGGSFIGVTGTIEGMIESLKIGSGFRDFELKNKEKYKEKYTEKLVGYNHGQMVYDYVMSYMKKGVIPFEKINKKTGSKDTPQSNIGIYHFILRTSDIEQLKKQGFTNNIAAEEILNYWEDYYNE